MNKPATPANVASNEGLGRQPEPDALGIEQMEHGPGLRLFARRGATTWFNRGFRTKAAADEWVDWHRRQGFLDWRAGWTFRLLGDARDVEIVDRHGRHPKA